MNKSELIDAIASLTDVSKKDVGATLDAFQQVVGEQLKAKADVVLVGFGTFKVKESAARTGRNPSTGAPMQIQAKTSAVFKAGKRLNDAVQ